MKIEQEKLCLGRIVNGHLSAAPLKVIAATWCLLTAILCLPVTAQEVALDIGGSDGCLFSVGKQCFSEVSGKTLLRRLAASDTNTIVRVYCRSNATAAQVAAVFGTIQESGLHIVLFVCGGTKEGVEGTYTLTIDCAKRSYADGCGYLGLWNSGFYTNGEGTSATIESWWRTSRGRAASPPGLQSPSNGAVKAESTPAKK